mgnify:CR=1 FL=1
MKRLLGFIASLVLLLMSVCTVYAAQNGHVIINQVYGASDDGYADHSFIELYNPTNKNVDLNGWSVQYRSSASGNQADSWAVLKLTGVIEANGYYLVRCGAVTKPSGSYQVPQGNQEWNMILHNKGVSVALLSNDTPLTGTFAGDVTADGFALPEGFVDLAAVGGNDGTTDQTPPAYEGAFASIQSKKKAIRRIGFADTDNNKADFEEINYSKSVSADKGPHAGSTSVIPTPSYTPVETTNIQYTGYFNANSAVKAKLIARYNAGAYSAEGGSAEITAYNAQNGFAYSVNGVKGTLDCVNMKNLKNGSKVEALTGTELKAAELAENAGTGFTYGDMTSVAVCPNGQVLAVAMQDADYTKPGRVLFFDCNKDGSLTYSGIAAAGIQPDMVTFTEDGAKVLTADEGEPRQGYTAAGAVDPKGSVTVIDVQTKKSTTVDFSGFDAKRSELVAAGIVLKKNTAPSADLEPEYIAVSGNKAYVALQEANAVAVLNMDTLQFENIFSLGFEDHSKVAIDLNKSDGKYSPKTYEHIKGIRMPDGISAATISGETYLLTANEGDSRAWPVGIETDVNEIKSKTSPVNSINTGGKVTWFDVTQYDGLEPGTDYIFGGRSFTVFKVTPSGLEEVFDSGSDFEKITAQTVPDYFNCSNDTIEAEDRSGKKGPEPEGITVGTIDGHTYAFIGLERTGGVMIYDITDPANAAFKNYFNSRDYSADIKDDVSPEGLTFVAAEKNGSGVPVLITSNEVSGTVSVMAMDADTTPPEILNVENGKTYYVTKKVVAYNDDESPVTVTLNGEPVEESFFLPGNCEATYTISAKDSVGNETVYTVYMKPISSITDKLGGLSESTVTSDDSALINEVEAQLLDIAGAFDENESTEAEWNELKAALDLCKKLENKIIEIGDKLTVLRTAVNEYSVDTVSKNDKVDLEKLAANAKDLLSSGNLTSAEKTETEALLSTVNGLLEKIGKSDPKPTQPEQPTKKPNKPQKPSSGETTSPKTGDTGDLSLWIILLAISGGVLTGVMVFYKSKKRSSK